MLPDLRFRPLRSDEWQLLRNVRLNALRESPQSFLAEYDQEEECGQERWQTEFDRGNWIVGELDGKHVCLTGVTRESGAPADERYLEYVWVAKAFRGQHISSHMLTSIIRELEKADVRTILLWTLENDNHLAQLLYKQLDFITTGQKQELKGRSWEHFRRDSILDLNESHGTPIGGDLSLVAAGE